MTVFETAHLTQAYRQHCEDRIAVWQAEERVVLIVADGAGGAGSGAAAAEAVIRELLQVSPATTTTAGWCAALQQFDLRIGDGESTAVVVDISPAGICGASVGDSQAWQIHDGEIRNLTIHQQRKPLLGTGEAVAVGFAAPPLDGLLLVATDGFCNYAKRPLLIKMLREVDFPLLPRKLVDLVRLPSGEYWDDVGLIVCRRRPPPRKGRKKFNVLEDLV